MHDLVFSLIGNENTIDVLRMVAPRFIQYDTADCSCSLHIRGRWSGRSGNGKENSTVFSSSNPQTGLVKTCLSSAENLTSS